MTDEGRPSGAALQLRFLGVASCIRHGLVAGVAAFLAVFLGAFVVWELVVPGIRQTIDAAFTGSRAVIGSALGAGTGLLLAVVLGIVAAVAVTAGSALAPLLLRAVVPRAGGLGVILAPAE